jgi:hypothetical protein
VHVAFASSVPFSKAGGTSALLGILSLLRAHLQIGEDLAASVGYWGAGANCWFRVVMELSSISMICSTSR